MFNLVVALFIWRVIYLISKGIHPKEPKFRVRVGDLHSIAECGCDIIHTDGDKIRVSRPCAAHRAMVDTTREF